MVVKFVWIILLMALFQSSTTQKTVLFFGDSLTAGYGLSSTDDAYPALIGNQLAKSGKPSKVINAGLSGETSAGGLSRIDWILRQPIHVFVLALGGNDGLRGLPPEQTKKNLQAIIDKVKAKNPAVKIVIAGMQAPPNMGSHYTNQFKIIFPELARQNKATLIPFLLEGVAGIEKLNQNDGIHPNVEGHKIIANAVQKVIAPLL
jgi:acyl-CoA thioesterase-1